MEDKNKMDNKNKKTWLYLLNILILQFFFIRLSRSYEKRIEEFELNSINFTFGGISSRGRGKTVKYKCFMILYFIVPFTGWNTEYKYLGQKNQFQITKYKKCEKKL